MSFNLVAISLFITFTYVRSFSINSSSGLERFYVICPADRSIVSRFDPTLEIHESQADSIGDEEETWAAVYRCSVNLPSALALDKYFKTTADSFYEVKQQTTSSRMIETTQAPVAIGRLRKSELHPGRQWVMDFLRCSLKKENLNPDCDGGSEHAEAVSACVDELLLYHLKLASNKRRTFDGSIRCKATLVSGPILEKRGFTPVEELSRDMATHLSSLEGALESYATRVSEVGGVVWNSGAGIRDRTLQIVSLLGSLDREEERNASIGTAAEISRQDDDDDSDITYDPWAAIRKYI